MSEINNSISYCCEDPSCPCTQDPEPSSMGISISGYQVESVRAAGAMLDTAMGNRDPTPEDIPREHRGSVALRLCFILEYVWLAHGHANLAGDSLMAERLQMIAEKLDKVISDAALESS